ncbi:DUF3857 domain-containing protein [Granulicella tundricola]|uniref:Transglutaminase domain-containing protein n=1 Tax=Granulicella tundricola (strain ATCC BAA-1859 / DSM 23138 / MP5ACTX9) TaxID=1198114 RepID=E8X1D9_GRATM|nr:DUF3857 and transglutaminase domain-containing protein [Granulicella tundricola]ADW69093.1 transglutaminase domain-containing protein [Granulicella tundricola MP5ACTX9]
MGASELRAQWTPPTAEELSMTSQEGAKGAPAVFLYKEQITDDGLRMHSYYVRLKVLTEGGKEYANVELPYVSGSAHLQVDSISGRTIHPDGTIIPFTGKPYDKLVAKGHDYKEMAKVFTMPSVEVGSILEYRYKLHYDDAYFESPDWYVQSDLYMRKAHYMWRPTTQLMQGEHGQTMGRIAWTPILPEGATVKQTDAKGGMRGNGEHEGGIQLDLDVHDIAPLPIESFMAPAASLSYRVMFFYSGYRTMDEFWKSEGKIWSKGQDKFVGPGNGVKAFVQQTVAAGDTPDQKLKKLYEAVMTLENTDFSRERSSQEEKANGFKQLNTTDDVLARKRGNGDQLSDLFVAMARATGFKAYVMGVANRDRRLFIPQYLNIRQLDDDIAIVNVNGKDEFFDPGQRYCEYRHLAWVHGGSGGVRQIDGGGTDMIETPLDNYKEESVKRVADLTLDEQGEATGTVKLTYLGDPALHWRQEALKGDDTSLNLDLRSNLERMLPGGMEVRVTNVTGLSKPDQPLVVDYSVKGAVGTPTGKRLLITGNLFEVNAKPVFPDSKREQAVYMHHPSFVQDAVRFKLPATMTVESAPKEDAAIVPGSIGFTASSKQSGSSITMFRNVTIAKHIFLTKEYPDLRGFYGKLETRDQEPLVLIHPAPGSASAATAAGPGN